MQMGCEGSCAAFGDRSMIYRAGCFSSETEQTLAATSTEPAPRLVMFSGTKALLSTSKSVRERGKANRSNAVMIIHMLH